MAVGTVANARPAEARRVNGDGAAAQLGHVYVVTDVCPGPDDKQLGEALKPLVFPFSECYGLLR